MRKTAIKKTAMTKVLSCILVFVILMSVVPVSVLAMDKVISDPTGSMHEGDTAKVSYPYDSPAHVDSVEGGDKVGVLGSYTGSESGEHIISLGDKGSDFVKASDITLLWENETADAVLSVSVSENGEYVAIGSRDTYVYYFNKIGDLIWKHKTNGAVNSVSTSNDGNYVIAGSNDCHIYYFDKDGFLWRIEVDERITTTDISSDGRYAIAGSWNKYVYFFDIYDTNKPLWKRLLDGYVAEVSISDNGEYIAIGEDGYVYLLDKYNTTIWKKDIGGGWYVDISGDGNYVIVGGGGLNGLTSYCYDRSGKLKWEDPYDEYLDDNHGGYHVAISSVSLSTDGSYGAVGSYGWDITIRSFDKTGNVVWRIKNDTYEVDISGDGHYIAAGASSTEMGERVLYIDNFDDGNIIYEYGLDYPAWVIDLSKDGKYFAAVAENTVYFFGPATDDSDGDDTKPDLTITDIWWDIENPKIGDELTFSYTVKNQDTVDTIAEFNNVLYIDGERYDQSARISLSAGEARDKYFPHRWTATAGDHTIKVIADGYGDIDESDETNNASIKTLEIVNLEGRVISDSSDDGIYDVTVTITPGGMTATTPPNGYYSFKDLSEGKYTITASKQGYTFNSVTVSVSKDTTTTAPTIIGSINRSIIDAEIVQEPKREDLDGTYIIGSRVPVSYTIKNTGEIEHTFYAGFSVRDKFNKYWDAPYMAVTLGKGDTMEVTLSWIVQEGVTVDHPYDVIIAVWAAQQNSYLYDNLARKEYKNAFTIISGGTHVSGWYLYREDQREVTVEGKVYTAIPATSHGSRSWLIKNENGNVEQNLETYKRAAEAASISKSITPRTVSTLRDIKGNFHSFFDASFFGVRTILWIRDTGSWLLGKFIVIAATGGSSIGKDLPTGDVLKFAAHEIAEQYKSKLIGDLTNLPRTKLTEKTIKKIFWEATVQNIRISADKLDDAINVIENHNEGEPWSYQEAHTYYTNYKEAVLIGMSSMDLTMGLQPGSDLGHQVVDIGIGVLHGATSIKFDEVLAVEVYKKFKDFKEFEQSAIVYLKYKEMFDEMELEFGTTAEQIQKDALKTPSISGTIKCPADIHAYDSQGRHVGLNPTGGNDLEISGAYYSGPDSEPESIVIFGQSEDIIFKIEALDAGEFDFTLIQNSETETTTVTYLDVPIIQTTEATVDVSERNPTYTMEIDDDCDGTTDWTKEPDSIETTGAESPKLCTSPDPPTTNFGTVQEDQTRTWDFFITNCGSGTLTWAITCDQAWLNVNPASDSTTTLDVVTVTIDTHDLSPGTHTGQITIDSNGGSKMGTVTVEVVPPTESEPKLCTSPDPPSTNFGTVPEDQTRTWDFFITNSGSDTLTWTITCDQPWLKANPAMGSTTTLDVVTVTIDTHDLSPGTHTGHITLTSNGGEKMGTITVNVPEQIRPNLCTSPDPPSHDFGTVAKDQTRTWDFDVRNCGSGTLTWSVSDDKNWISVYPTSGSTTTETDRVTVRIDTQGLSPGTHTGHITLTSNGGEKTGTITVNVPEQIRPNLCTSPTTPSHDFGTVAKDQTRTWDFDVTNCGSGTLTWSVSDAKNWMSVYPTSGSTTTERDTVTVRIDTQGLSPGTHTGHITLTSNGGEKTGTITVVVPQPENQPPENPTITPDRSSPQLVGTTIKWTASAIDPDGDPLYYQFRLKGPATGNSWQIKRDWSTARTWTWYTTASDVGDTDISVRIRDGHHASTSSYDLKKTVYDYKITADKKRPTATIDSITPNPATQGDDTVRFKGHGYDSDGYIVEYYWKSSKDGKLSSSKEFTKSASNLDVGTHTVSFKVKDDDGLWSDWATMTLKIKEKKEDSKYVKFRGVVTGTGGIIGYGYWYVNVDSWISGSLSCDEIYVIRCVVPPMGSCDPDISTGDRVEVYGDVNQWGDGECSVGLNGESYYIKKV